jgi:hypothetical protein
MIIAAFDPKSDRNFDDENCLSGARLYSFVDPVHGEFGYINAKPLADAKVLSFEEIWPAGEFGCGRADNRCRPLCYVTDFRNKSETSSGTTNINLVRAFTPRVRNVTGRHSLGAPEFVFLRINVIVWGLFGHGYFLIFVLNLAVIYCSKLLLKCQC